MSVIDLLAGASRSTTPLSLLSRNKSPSADMAVQVNQQHQSVGNRDAGHKRQQQQQPISRGAYNRDQRDSGRSNDYVSNQYDNRNQYQRNNNNQQNRGGWMNRNSNMNMNNMRNPNNRGRGGPPRMNNQVRSFFLLFNEDSS